MPCLYCSCLVWRHDWHRLVMSCDQVEVACPFVLDVESKREITTATAIEMAIWHAGVWCKSVWHRPTGANAECHGTRELWTLMSSEFWRLMWFPHQKNFGHWKVWTRKCGRKHTRQQLTELRCQEGNDEQWSYLGPIAALNPTFFCRLTVW